MCPHIIHWLSDLLLTLIIFAKNLQMKYVFFVRTYEPLKEFLKVVESVMDKIEKSANVKSNKH